MVDREALNMGRASRRKAELRQGLREPTDREAWRQAIKADRRGRRIGSRIEEYERVCSAGSDRLVETLIARHTLRMDRVVLLPDFYRFKAMSGLAPVFWLDKLLRRYGATPGRHPSSYGATWADQLAWGVDSAVASTRLLLCGQITGAAAVARNQLERWTLNRAHNASTVQAAGESTVNFIARVWSTDDFFTRSWFESNADTEVPLIADEDNVTTGEPTISHQHVRSADGTEICPAALYGFLSEIMHGRMLPQALAWDADELLRTDELPPEVYVGLGAVTETLVLCLRQIRLGAAFLARERQDAGAIDLLMNRLDGFSEAKPVSAEVPDESHMTTSQLASPPGGRLVSPPIAALAPLAPGEGLSARFLRQVDGLAGDYEATLRGQRPAGRLFKDDELTMLAFASHRAHSAHVANHALEHERRFLGDSFNIDSLGGRVTRWVVLTEAAALLGLWHPQSEVRNAASLAGSGLRSAYWLWLEDDSRAMSILRCVLEQAARMRTWRRKPDKARVLEGREQTTPRDWLEAAGWKRLIVLNRALGEFAHMRVESNWTGAHELLAKLQMNVSADTAIYTARGASLDFVSDLVACEVAAAVTELSSKLGSVLAELLNNFGYETAEGTTSVESRFNHIWRLRAEGLGTLDPRRPHVVPLKQQAT
jgi:hypothetical protein